MRVRRAFVAPLARLGPILAVGVLGCPGPDVLDDAAPREDGFALDRATVDGASPDVPELDATGLEVADGASVDLDSGESVIDSGSARVGGSLRFFGYGREAVDRVVIPLDAPPRPVDIGESDFTVELFVRMRPGDNPATGCRAVADGWIEGHGLVDRDVYGATKATTASASSTASLRSASLEAARRSVSARAPESMMTAGTTSPSRARARAVVCACSSTESARRRP
jgi:hypothetical protein